MARGWKINSQKVVLTNSGTLWKDKNEMSGNKLVK
jgi:hypothetical protein